MDSFVLSVPLDLFTLPALQSVYLLLVKFLFLHELGGVVFHSLSECLVHFVQGTVILPLDDREFVLSLLVVDHEIGLVVQLEVHLVDAVGLVTDHLLQSMSLGLLLLETVYHLSL